MGMRHEARRRGWFSHLQVGLELALAVHVEPAQLALVALAREAQQQQLAHPAERRVRVRLGTDKRP
jgi:hypothetical protein